ncbi:MAG: peptidylprolyl isomerase [Pseudomonadales bacterium]|nr:peptidylprolyl isomerase [Pseudomonadales bacterium]
MPLRTKITRNSFRSLLYVGVMSLSLTPITFAGTLVEVQTSLGNFYLEMNDEAAPDTVANFLDYVRDRRFNNTYIHAAIGGTFIRGGSFSFDDCNAGPVPIATNPPIAIEETGLNNLSGTIAMRRAEEGSSTVTSEWYINIGDDSEADSLHGENAVFGKVIGDGLSTVLTISQAPGVRLTSIHTAPTSNYFGDENVNCRDFSKDNLVQVLMSVVNEEADSPSADYNSLNGRLNVNLDLGEMGFSNLDFAVDTSTDPITIQANAETSVSLPTPVPNMGTYNSNSGLLNLPSAAVDGELQFRNLVFSLTDADRLVFTLTSVESGN